MYNYKMKSGFEFILTVLAYTFIYIFYIYIYNTYTYTVFIVYILYGHFLNAMSVGINDHVYWTNANIVTTARKKTTIKNKDEISDYANFSNQEFATKKTVLLLFIVIIKNKHVTLYKHNQ